MTVAPSLIHHERKCCHAFQYLCTHQQTGSAVCANRRLKVTTSLWHLKKPSCIYRTGRCWSLGCESFISSSSVCCCQILSWNHLETFVLGATKLQFLFSCCNYVVSGKRPICTINPAVVFAFTSNISCNYTVESSYKDAKSHSPVVSRILTNRINVGQLKSKVGRLETSVYFIITMNFIR